MLPTPPAFLAATDDLAALLFLLIYLAVVIICIAGMWMTFKKAGQPGWAVIVPIYNLYVLTQIVGRPWWFLLLMFIPIVSFIVGIVLMVDLAKAFGRGIGFALGLIFLGPIFMCILGFGSAQYVGPQAR